MRRTVVVALVCASACVTSTCAATEERSEPTTGTHEITSPYGLTVTRPNDVVLSGQIELPQTNSKTSRTPVVVLVSGSGAQDRTSNVFGFPVFDALTTVLLDEGFAVARFDDRGVGKSSGDLSLVTTSDLADDIVAVIETIRRLDFVDGDRIGVMGHSEGGVIGPMVAARFPRLSFLVLLAPSTITGEEILLAQGRQASSDTDRQAHMQRMAFAFARGGKVSRDELTTVMSEIVDAELTLAAPQMTAEQRRVQTDAIVNANIDAVGTPWFRFFLDYDPGIALKNLSVPTLIVFGENDKQVEPSRNRPTAELTTSGQVSTTIVTIPKMNHLLQVSVTGDVSEYPRLSPTLSPAFVVTLRQWMGPLRH